MKRLLLLLIIPFVSLPIFAQAQNKLDAGQSKIEFIAVKDEGIKVSGVFKTMDGTFTFGGKDALVGTVDVDIDSVSTGNPVRDTNLKNIFFETNKNPSYKMAHFVLKGRRPRESILVDGQPVNLKGDLEMHGKKVKIELTVSVKETPTSVEVKTLNPIVLDFTKWNFMGNVPSLMKACGHKNLEPKASLNLDLVFAKNS